MMKIDMFDPRTGQPVVLTENAPKNIVEAAAEVRDWMEENKIVSFGGLKIDTASSADD